MKKESLFRSALSLVLGFCAGAAGLPLLAQEMSSDSLKQESAGKSKAEASVSSSAGADSHPDSDTINERRENIRRRIREIRSKKESSSSSSSSPEKRSEIKTEKPSVKFIPKYRPRILAIGEQIKLAKDRGFIDAAEAATFMDRQAKLLLEEESLASKEAQKEELSQMEKAITLLNSDLFKAMRKTDPVKPGSAEAEVHDPNLIPAYPDPELQPGSGLKPETSD